MSDVSVVSCESCLLDLQMAVKYNIQRISGTVFSFEQRNLCRSTGTFIYVFFFRIWGCL